MKLALAALPTAAAVTACGAETATKIPAAKDLIGTWSQNGAGYEEGKPVTWKDQTLVVEAAEGQGFVGFKEYENEGEDRITSYNVCYTKLLRKLLLIGA